MKFQLRKKIVIALVALSAAALLLSACSNSGGTVSQTSTDAQQGFINTDPPAQQSQESREESSRSGFINTDPPYDYSSRASQTQQSGSVVYFDDPIGWGDTYIYYWSDANKNMVKWPGDKMEKFEGVWRYSMPGDAQYIIFSNGAMQTRDIPYDPAQTNYRLSSKRDQDNSYYVEDWQGNVINSDRVDPKGKYN